MELIFERNSPVWTKDGFKYKQDKRNKQNIYRCIHPRCNATITLSLDGELERNDVPHFDLADEDLLRINAATNEMLDLAKTSWDKSLESIFNDVLNR